VQKKKTRGQSAKPSKSGARKSGIAPKRKQKPKSVKKITKLKKKLPKKVVLTSMSKSSNLAAARAAKEDEFYTQLADIERELSNYREHFVGKTVYCNCDDPRVSGFVHYFSYNFEKLGLKKLIATCYRNIQPDLFSQNDSDFAIKLEYSGDMNKSGVPDPSEFEVQQLKGDGDFRSQESIDLLNEADIVVTNPPFSLYREYINQLIDNDKRFILLGPQSAISYKGIFQLLKEGHMWLGKHSGAMTFRVPDSKEKEGLVVDDVGNKWQNFGNICWYTNLDLPRRHEDLILYKNYNSKDYPKYDNYDAIEVSKVADIPMDYEETMGVPYTFFNKHNPEQFEIIGITKAWFGVASKIYPKQIQVNKDGSKIEVTKLNDCASLEVPSKPKAKTYYVVDGKKYIAVYPRILIRKIPKS
jgi:predicted transcriptional regulator YdeE